MTDFTPIKEVIATRKGNIKGVVIRQSDLKSGTKNGNDWSRKTFTIQDASGDIEITAFNEEIQFLKVGQCYEIESPWWKEYNGNWSLNIGQYCKITKVDNPPTQTTTNKIQQLEPIEEKLPDSLILPSDVESETIVLLQIEEIVINTMKKFKPGVEPNSQKVGMFVKEIYRRITIPNFRKASDVK